MNKPGEKVMQGVFLVSALMSIIALLTIIYFIFANGLPIMFRYGFFDFIFGTEWRPSNNPPMYGLLPMITGSIFATLGAAILGVPVGVLTAIFMAEFCPDWLYKVLKPAVTLMASIPSIVMGFFALRLLVPAVRENFGGNGYSMLSAILILSIMILPTIIELSESALKTVPRTYYSASIAMGASHERSVMNVLVPAAKSGVLSSVVLGIGRAIGETMAVVLVAGNQPIMPGGLLQGMRTLTINIVLEMGYATGEHREALIATAVVLFVFIFIINGSFLVIKNKGDNQ
ncbi:Phosphate transport system permease protein pstC [Alloiococcus otitis]|uniref:Phosphate transport system permease protein n=1 Tax=Alloiococcus otitis ATCC 51267 TaxID=883081 RepID=K9EVR2_9LACT|nr:phosphate ABC transporter permease subunit PstC [Alloiococcus otitis]EKU93280.1 phosphate ABC transporter, permease PstC [Alloiococcus otitis ATCC 51267]SUU80618.1 Phosphate transport system permease protein pstC [Alloiococcus otitis]